MTESINISQFIKSLAERKGVPEDRIKEIIIESFRKSYCKEENSQVELNFEFNDGLSVYRLYQIVEKVSDPEKEITKNDKLLKKGKVKDGKLFLPLDIKNFSISLSNEIRKQFLGDLREIGQERQDDLFIRKLLEQEIPQIKEGIVAIRHILRVPGLVSKVVVEKGKIAIEKGLGINPAGACIGERGERAKSVSRLAHERIEIVNWSENQKILLDNFLSPAKVVELIEKGNDWVVTVLQERASLVLEHQGKMLKEISNYLGKNIHVRGLEDIKKEKNTIIVWNGKLDDKEVEVLCKKLNS